MEANEREFQAVVTRQMVLIGRLAGVDGAVPAANRALLEDLWRGYFRLRRWADASTVPFEYRRIARSVAALSHETVILKREDLDLPPDYFVYEDDGRAGDGGGGVRAPVTGPRPPRPARDALMLPGKQHGDKGSRG